MADGRMGTTANAVEAWLQAKKQAAASMPPSNADWDKPEPPPECSLCLDTGWARRTDAPGFTPCDCGINARRRREFILSLSSLPERMTLDSWAQREGLDDALAEARRCAAGEQDYHVLVLSGGFGTGKTHLAAAVIRALAERGQMARLRYVPRLRQELYDTFSTHSTENVLRSYAEAGVLALDDFGAGRGDPTGPTIELFEDIINSRYQNGPLLIVTTNLDDGETRARWGGRIADRLFDRHSGLVKQVILDAPSFRTGERNG